MMMGQHVPGERRHPLDSLVQLEVGLVDLGVPPEVVAEPLLLFPLLNHRVDHHQRLLVHSRCFF